MAGSSDTTRTMKRRGILAAAGAVVATFAMPRSSQSVRATTDTTFLATGGNVFAYSTSSGYLVGVSASGTYYGVAASSSAGHALYGSTFAAAGSGMAGVFGYGNGNGTFGLLSDGLGGVGVQGQNAQVGVVGLVNNADNTIGVYGNNLSTGANGIGVYGSCAKGTGVYGQTSASNQYGVLGTTYAANSTAIAGTCTGNGSSAFSGGTANPNAFAAFFQGTTVVQGNFAVTGTKSAALAHPDGSHRLVYCVETPESWLEDVGTGTLTAGKASVTFEKDFAALIHTDQYHVFLTEYGETQGLFVSQRSTSGFVVQERNKGTASGTFSWRAMVRRGDVNAERLGKFTMPNLPLPDPAKIKAPDLPTPTVPPKKP